MKIAIIGSGIAGLTCAYQLHRRHDIRLFEANDYLGGHTHTVDVTLQGQHYAIDTGFIVFNDWTYPRFIALLQEWGVEYQPTEMSFSVQNPALDLEYNGHSLTTLFAQKRNLLRPWYWRFLAELVRFNRHCLAWQGDPDLTLGQFLKAEGYSQLLADNYVLPIVGAIWSCGTQGALGFPMRFFVEFFRNHGLFNLSDRPQWYVIKGGSRAYIDKACAGFGDRIRLSCPVTRIERHPEGVRIQSPAGSETFDALVLACHSDTALRLLADPSSAETQVLGDLPYQSSQVLLHTDISVLPRRRAAWASWNFQYQPHSGQHPTLSYDMNRLQGIQAAETFCVTLNPSRPIAEDRILGRFEYSHPQYGLASLAAQARRAEINGVRRTYYCGAYWYNGFHEDGVRSAQDVCQLLEQAHD